MLFFIVEKKKCFIYQHMAGIFVVCLLDFLDIIPSCYHALVIISITLGFHSFVASIEQLNYS